MSLEPGSRIANYEIAESIGAGGMSEVYRARDTTLDRDVAIKVLPDAGADVSQSPTLTKGTALGVILGTASYMSPEQAKGKAVDKRTDLWAFGCVLYEVLTGKKAFPGEDASDALAAVIRAEPDFEKLPTETPTAIRRMLRRCLTKDARDRLADIADARIEIADAETRPADVAPYRFTPAVWQQPKWLAGALLVALGFAIRNPSRTNVPDAAVTRYVVTLPETDMLNMTTGGLAVSPDGQRLAYVANHNRAKRLFVRERDEQVGVLEELGVTKDQAAAILGGNLTRLVT